MRISIMYKTEVGGIREPLYNIMDDNKNITHFSTWLTNNLCLSFSSLEDLDKAIDNLQGLKTEVVNRMVTRGETFVPSDYQCKDEPVIDISVYMDVESDKYRINVDTVDGYSNQLDVISFSKNNGFTYQTLELFIEAGGSIDIGQRILTEAIRNKVRKEG